MPTVRQQLGELLRHARDTAGMGQQALAAALGVAQSQVSRVENGQRALSAAATRRWMEQLRASSDEVAAAVELAEQAEEQVAAWEDLRSEGWAKHQQRYADEEREADAEWIFQSELIPGLLQSPRYVEYLMREVICRPEEDVPSAVSARLARQAVLLDPATQLSVVITEDVLRRPFGGPSIMAEQLDRLVTSAHLPTVDLAVLPTNVRMPQVSTVSFVLDEMPDRNDSKVTIELPSHEVTILNPTRVDRYRRLFRQFQQHSLRGDNAVEFVKQIADTHRGKRGES